MHKIKKGIKKKIKGKKGKDKEDDLFDPEQLAKYKKELEEAAAAAAEGKQLEDPNSEEEVEPQPAKSHQEDEEWQKFKLLTSGIDSVLKKTSGDLDRIKSSSFFQRTQPNPAFILPTASRDHFPQASSQAQAKSGSLPPFPHSSAAPEGKQKKGSRWVDVETGHQAGEEESLEVEQEATVDGPVEQAEEDKSEDREPESPEVEAVVVDDDLFDTSFVDAVATGDIKLAYIPDSPTELEQGDDPFDTSAVADVVKKIEEEERKKKRQVNLGLAVNVLTGKALEDNNSCQAATVKAVTKDVTQGTRRPRPRNINLLGDFDVDATTLDISPKEDSTPPERPADLFDALLETTPFGAGDVVVPITRVSPTKEDSSSKEPDSNNLDLHELLSEFDVISAVDEPAVVVKLEDDLDDEFAALAAQSLHKEPSAISATQSPAPTRPPPPSKPPPAAEEQPDEEDPFDTSFAANIPLGKSELKIVERQLFHNDSERQVLEEDDFDFDPRAGEEICAGNLQTNLPVRRDLLGGSSSDLSSLSAVDPIHPESNGLIETEIHDPFDTSVVENLLPGKAELKLLEAELLTVDELVDDDFHDFDPRKDETREGNPSVTITHPIAPRRPPPPKVPEIHPLDLIDDSQSQIKALTPQTEITDFQDQIDPFDTSSVSGAIVPGKFELKLLESELVEETCVPAGAVIASAPSAPVTDSPEFNPREDKEVPVASLVETVPQDIFDSPSHVSKDKPLTPTINQSAHPNFQDPFDTSALVSQNILPGKAELRFLEKELLNSVEDFQPPSLPAIPQLPKPERPLTPEQIREPHPLELDEDQDFFGGGHEPLRPLTPSNLAEALVFDDPFDTTIANTIAPGKAELKILEAELVSDSFSDADFNPRATSTLPTAPLVPQTLPPTNTFETVDVDPFDTSAADGILPGKAELKILEAELL